jgi:FixJ family two-component response regulator
MSGLTGYDLEKHGSKGIRIPVIAVSAFEGPETRGRTRDVGATAFFRRPVDGQALTDAVRWATGERR